MVLHKQLRVLNWGTPIKVYEDDVLLFDTISKTALAELQSGNPAKNFFVKAVKLIVPENTASPFLEIRVKSKSTQV